MRSKTLSHDNDVSTADNLCWRCGTTIKAKTFHEVVTVRFTNDLMKKSIVVTRRFHKTCPKDKGANKND